MFSGGADDIFESAYGGYDGGAVTAKLVASAVQVVAVLALILTATVSVFVSAGVNPGTNVMGLYRGLSAWLTVAIVALLAADAVRSDGWPSVLARPWAELRATYS